MITLRKLVYFHPDAVIDTCLFVSEFIENNFDEEIQSFKISKINGVTKITFKLK